MTRMRLLFGLIFLAACPLDSEEAISEGEKRNWVDPNDMTSFDINTNSMKSPSAAAALSKPPVESEGVMELRRELKECRSNLFENQSLRAKPDTSQCGPINQDLALVKHTIRKLCNKLKLGEETLLTKERRSFDAVIELDPLTLRIFHEVVNDAHEVGSDGYVSTLQDAAEAISGMFRRVRTRKDRYADSTYADTFWKQLPSILQIGNLIAIVPILGLVCTRIIKTNKWNIAMTIFFISFFASVIWTWLHLYKIKQVEIQTRLIQEGVPVDCRSDSTSVGDWLRNLLVVAPENKCLQYQKDLLIDPIWEVTPTEAFAITLTKFFVSPSEILGASIAKFFSSVFGNLHVTLWPLVTVALSAGSFSLLILLCGYSIRLPFGLLTIGPSSHVNGPIPSQLLNQNQRPLHSSAEPSTGIVYSENNDRRMLHAKRRKRKTEDVEHEFVD